MVKNIVSFFKTLRKMLSINLGDYGFEIVTTSPVKENWEPLVLVYFGNLNYKNQLEGFVINGELYLRERKATTIWKIKLSSFKENQEKARPLMIVANHLPVSFHQLDEIILDQITGKSKVEKRRGQQLSFE